MPLSKEQMKEVQDGLAKAEESLQTAKADLQTAKRAGIDVADRETHVKELELQLRRLKAVYGK